MTETEAAARFERLAMPHMDAVYNLARWLTGDAHEAQDVAQESMLRAYRFFSGFRGEDARAWLLKIVRNTYYTQWRQARAHETPAEFDEELHSPGVRADAVPRMTRACADPESVVASGEEMRLLDRALAGLPVEFREALVLRELEDLSYKEIAATLDIPIGTVMSRLARGRLLLLDSFRTLSGEDHGMQRSQKPDRRVR
jgi:RNA polymerase sigma-70 factor (ECF subfamily)